MASRPELIAGRAFVLIEAVDRTGMALNRISGHLRQWANQMQSIGTIVLKVSIASALPIGYAIKQFAEYENRMSRIAVLMDEPGKHMANAATEIDRIAETYGVSVENLQAGYQTMVSGGMDPGVALTDIEAAAKAARGFRIEVNGTAEAVRRLVMGFRITGEEATDLMFAMDRGGIDAQEMVLQLGMAVPMARAAGIGWKEFGGMIAAISTVVPTHQVMTAMKNITSEFLKPSAEGAKKAREYGFELSVATLQAGKFGDILKKIMFMPGKTEAQKMEDLATIFPDMRGLLGVTQLAQNLDTFDQMMQQVENSAGLTERAWQQVSKDTKVAMDKAWASIVRLAREIGSKLAPVTLSGAAKLQHLSQKVADYVTNNQRLIVTITAVTAGMITMGATLVTTALGLRVLAFTIGQLGMLMRLVVAPFYILEMLLVNVLGTVFALIQGIYSLSAAFLVFTFATSPARFGLVALMGLLLYKVHENKAAVAALSNEYGKWWNLNTTGMAGGLAQWFTSMIPKVRELGQTLSTTFFGLTDALMMGDLDAAWTLSLKGMELSWLQTVDMFKSTWEAFIKFFTQAWMGAQQLVTPLQESMTAAIAERMAADPEAYGIEAAAQALWRKMGVTWEPLAGPPGADEKKAALEEERAKFHSDTIKPLEDKKRELEESLKTIEFNTKVEREEDTAGNGTPGKLFLLGMMARRRLQELKNVNDQLVKARSDELKSRDENKPTKRVPLDEDREEYDKLIDKLRKLNEFKLKNPLLGALANREISQTVEAINKILERGNALPIPDRGKAEETAPTPDAVRRSLEGEPGEDWLAKVSADYAAQIAAVSGEMLGAGGAQDPELFAKQQARIEAMTKLKEELDALRESIKKNREEYDKKQKEKWDQFNTSTIGGMFNKDTAIDALMVAFPGLSEAAKMLGPLLNMAGSGIIAMTGEQPDYKIPATETIMAASKEAAEFMKKIWQEEHLPAGAQTDAEQNAAVRSKLLEVLPLINGYLRKIAGAEGV